MHHHRHPIQQLCQCYQHITATWRKQVDAVAMVSPAVRYLFVLRKSKTRHSTLHAFEMSSACLSSGGMPCRNGRCTDAFDILRQALALLPAPCTH